MIGAKKNNKPSLMHFLIRNTHSFAAASISSPRPSVALIMKSFHTTSPNGYTNQHKVQ